MQVQLQNGCVVIIVVVVQGLQLEEEGEKVADDDASVDGERAGGEEVCIELAIGAVDKIDWGPGSKLGVKVRGANGARICIGGCVYQGGGWMEGHYKHAAESAALCWVKGGS